MKKWGLFWLILFLPSFVYAYSNNKTVSNPYQIFDYKIKYNSNSTTVNSTSTSDLRTIQYNSNVDYRFDGTVSLMTSQVDWGLDLIDGAAMAQDEADLNFIIIPMCVSKLDFSVEITSSSCSSSCLSSQKVVPILYGSYNSCQLSDSNMVGPVQYLSDPYSGTLALLTLTVKKWNVDIPNTHTAKVQDHFIIKNNQSDSTLYYRFLSLDNYDGGLFDRNGINGLSLQYNSLDVAQIQNASENGKYNCKQSNNLLRINYNDNTVWDSTNKRLLLNSSSAYYRNFDERNLFNINGSYIGQSSYQVNGNDLSVTGKWYAGQLINVDINTNYYLSFSKYTSSSFVPRVSVYDSSLTNLIKSCYSSCSINTGNHDSIYLLFYSGTGTSNNVVYSNIQFEKGLNFTEYVPYSLPSIFISYEKCMNTPSTFKFYSSNLNTKDTVIIGTRRHSDLKIQSHDLVSCGLLNEKCWYNGLIDAYNNILFWQTRAEYCTTIIQLKDITKDIYFEKAFIYNNDDNDDTYLSNPYYTDYGKYVCYKDDGSSYDYITKNQIFNPSDGQAIKENPYFNYIGDVNIKGLSTLALLPNNFLTSVKNGICVPIDLSFKIRGQNVNAVTLPCGQSFWNRNDLAPFRPFISTFITGLVVYRITMWLYRVILKARKPGHLYLDGVDMGEISDL